MASETEQTIMQYAKISKIPLEKILEDLRNFNCNADNILTEEMRRHLNMLAFFKELNDNENALEQEIEAEDAEDFEMKSLVKELFLEMQSSDPIYRLELLRKNSTPEAKKIGQVLDLCLDLLPGSVAKKILIDCQEQLFEKIHERPEEFHLVDIGNLAMDRGDPEIDLEHYLSNSDLVLKKINFKIEEQPIIYHWITSNWQKYAICLSNNKNLSDIYLNILFNGFILNCNKIDDESIYCVIGRPKWIAQDYYINEDLKIEQSINNHKKNNRYTAALIEIIYHLLRNISIKEDLLNSISPFKELYYIGELLIEIGAIDSALELYNIDETIFSAPNILSLLATRAVQSGNLNESIKLVAKLTDREPYHPSIPIIQAEIKRLEQRNHLKAALSIDFSKIDELSGIEFENLLLDKFVTLGFVVEPTPKTGDFGADLIVETNDGSRIIFQCKRFKSKINLKAVQEVVGAMGHYAGDYGVVVTNNTFLNSAVKLAQSHDIELWDGDKLISFLAGDLSFSEILS